MQQGSGGYTTRIRRLYNKDEEVISTIFLLSVLLSALVENPFVYILQLAVNTVQRNWISRLGRYLMAYPV